MNLFIRLFKRFLILLMICLFYFANTEISFSQLPLITDNTGTQGKGNGQIEISNGLAFHNEHRCIENSSEISPVFTFGIFDNTDFVVGYPFLNSSVQDDTSISIVSGFSDLNMEIKYRFLQNEVISLAIKPGISFPTGNYIEGLGSGRFSESLFFIMTAEFSSMYINGNLGYLRNENKCGDAINIWHASVDADFSLSDEFHFVLNSGIEKNPNLTVKTNPVFGLVGFYYFINENCEISIGYKYGITKTETNHAFIYGLTLRF